MYMLANSSKEALPTTSSWRQRRPNLTLAKSSQWSYSASNRDRAYPSPPMSNSPTTPSRLSQFVEIKSPGNSSVSVTSAPSERPSTSAQVTQGSNMEGPTMAMPATHLQQRYGQQPGMYIEPRHEIQPRPITTNPQFTQQYQGYPQAAQPSIAPMGFQASRGQPLPSAYQGPVSVAGPENARVTRTSRRAKAHVARACQNCKKAHLSCDEVRPCARCVSSGKQATCVDVEHKKRGRPRLRDDREQRLELAAAAAIAAQNSQQAHTQPRVQMSGFSRVHRRADSLRVLRSSTQGPAPQSPMTLPAPDRRGLQAISGPSTGYSSYYPPPPLPEPARTPGPAITAFLNMDLQILRASDSFIALFHDGRDLRGRHLSDFVAATQQPNLQRMQFDLRDERTRREPTFLPGIFPGEQEQNVIQNHDVEDVDMLSHGYDDHRRETYTFILPGGRTEQIQIRLRLARTSTFFATLVLYRMASQIAPATSAFSRRQSLDPFSAMGAQPSPTHSTISQSSYTASAPVSPFSTLPQALMTTLPPTSSSMSSTYGTSPAGGPSSQGYFTCAPPTMMGMYPPPPPLSRPPSQPAESYAQSQISQHQGRERRRPEPLLQGSIQLPPITSSAPTTPITSHRFEQQQHGTSMRPSQVVRTATEDEEDTRKRRRLNIKEIIDE
ncbi:hypothetical protein EJ08DRAFT_664850 [Tothia fuscella]|uniref:Zn(2)-C6 fungal-type domain-containing protein n=1 Tax=Tothia fuscella TaxID=1048955 RepID=A0A9P4NHR9_9PEZI|nr:hypothetical protein EJ08DRAFT_664850 [Tothia fuscella]